MVLTQRRGQQINTEGRLPAATMSLIGKVVAVWRNLFGPDKQPALAEAVENVGVVGVLRSQLAAAASAADAAAGIL